jgi:hypothetical protein
VTVLCYDKHGKIRDFFFFILNKRFVFCVLCLSLVPLPPGKTPFAVQLNNNNNNSVHRKFRTKENGEVF